MIDDERMRPIIAAYRELFGGVWKSGLFWAFMGLMAALMVAVGAG